jgi:hypothetical protein
MSDNAFKGETSFQVRAEHGKNRHKILSLKSPLHCVWELERQDRLHSRFQIKDAPKLESPIKCSWNQKRAKNRTVSKSEVFLDCSKFKLRILGLIFEDLTKNLLEERQSCLEEGIEGHERRPTEKWDGLASQNLLLHLAGLNASFSGLIPAEDVQCTMNIPIGEPSKGSS